MGNNRNFGASNPDTYMKFEFEMRFAAPVSFCLLLNRKIECRKLIFRGSQYYLRTNVREHRKGEAPMKTEIFDFVGFKGKYENDAGKVTLQLMLYSDSDITYHS